MKADPTLQPNSTKPISEDLQILYRASQNAFSEATSRQDEPLGIAPLHQIIAKLIERTGQAELVTIPSLKSRLDSAE
jgi:hypothetical protein